MLPDRPSTALRRTSGLSIEHLWAMAVLTIVFFFVSTHPIRPHDFWWHLRAGQEITGTGHIPTTDQYSFTVPGQPYANYSAFWLADSALYLFYAAGGPALVIFVHSLAITAAYALVLSICRQVSASWRIAALATFFAALLGYNNWNVRPQSIAFPLFALFLWAIYAYRRRPRSWLLAIFPLGMVLWVNSHGTFVLGPLLLAIWLADEVWQGLKAMAGGGGTGGLRGALPPGVALAATALTTLLNPRGLQAWRYVVSFQAAPVVHNLVVEFAAPTFGSPAGALFLLGLLLAAVVMALSPRRPTFFQVLSFIAFAVVGLLAVRGAAWFGMALAPVLADHVAAMAGMTKWGARESRTGRAGLTYAVAVAIGLGMVLSLPWLKHWLPLPPIRQGLVSGETPVAATEFLLRERPPGQLFHELSFGSYLIWAAQPDYPVFVDTRIELYPPQLWLEYLELSTARGDWEGTLARHGVNTLMLSPQGQPALVAAARASEKWTPAYEDEAAVVFVRTDHPWWQGQMGG